MAGRPRKPEQFKVLQGTSRPDRINRKEPKLQAEIPRAGIGLTEKDKKAWRHIARIIRPMKIATKADVIALEELVTAHVDFWEARRVIDRLGSTYISKAAKKTEADGKEILSVVIRRRPEVEIMTDAWRRIEKMLSHFGLSPSSRSKVSVVGELKKVDPFEQFEK